MNIIVRSGVFCVFFCVAVSPVLATNGYFAHGYGTKNKGLAGAGVALAQDAMSAATNPSGMVFVGNRMDVGGAIFSPSPRSYDVDGPANANCAGPMGPCSFTIGPGSIESENDYFLIPHFGRNWMIDSNGSVGVTVYGNGGMNTEYKGGKATFFDPIGGVPVNDSPGTFGAGTTGVDLAQLFINTSYSRKFSDTGSWGASAILAYQRFEAKGLANFSAYSSDPSNLTNNDYDTSTGFGFKFGIQGEVVGGLMMAASYQSEIKMSEFDDYAGLFAEDGDFDIPATVTIGMALKVSPNSTFVFDVQRIYYSDVASVGNPIEPLLNGSCQPVPPGGPGIGDGCLGGSNGAGFGWEDMTIYKIGYQWASNSWTWRLGYSEGDQPIPKDQVLFNILAPAVIEKHLTFGFTRQMSQQSEFNFAIMHALKESVKGPNRFDITGVQEIELEMSQIEIEANYSKKF